MNIRSKYILWIITFSVSLSIASCGNGSTTGEVDLSTSGGIFGWRESDRTGNSPEAGLLKEWPVEGPELIWVAKELLPGFSSVAIGNNTIYTTGQDGENDFLIAIDNKGKVLWKTPYGRVWKASFPESRCTPTVEADRVYVSSGFGDIACIDGKSGKIIWSDQTRENFKGTTGDWGIAESLLLDGNKLYFTPGGAETMTIAMDKMTGEIIWKSESINDSPSYTSPVLVEFEGIKLIINVGLRYAYAVNASDGTILWKIDHAEAIDSRKAVEGWNDAPKVKSVSPLVKDGRIYFSGGYDHGGALLEMTDSGRSVKVVWTDNTLDIHHGGAILVNGHIYGSSWINNKDGNWCCLDWATGKVMYEEKWKSKGSIISADGLLYIYEEKSGFVGLVRPNPGKFDLISSFRVKEGTGPHWAHPVIHNGILYIRHGDALMSYRIKE